MTVHACVCVWAHCCTSGCNKAEHCQAIKLNYFYFTDKIITHIRVFSASKLKKTAHPVLISGSCWNPGQRGCISTQQECFWVGGGRVKRLLSVTSLPEWQPVATFQEHVCVWYLQLALTVRETLQGRQLTLLLGSIQQVCRGNRKSKPAVTSRTAFPLPSSSRAASIVSSVLQTFMSVLCSHNKRSVYLGRTNSTQHHTPP